MKKGVTLVELIFTVVIIAMVFTVIPKIIFALNKSDSFAIRQDALLNGVSMFHMISNMPWDENNTNHKDILHTDSGNFDCNKTTNYRIGGFVGSRKCEDNLSATAINQNENNGSAIWSLNDIGDFNNTLVDVNASGKLLYELNISVCYVDDNNSVLDYNYSKGSVYIDLNKTASEANSTNLKKIDMIVSYSGERGKKRVLARFNYISANLGLIEINKREW